MKKRPHASVKLLSPGLLSGSGLLLNRHALFAISTRPPEHFDDASPVKIGPQVLTADSGELGDRYAPLDRNAALKPIRDGLSLCGAADAVCEIRYATHQINGTLKCWRPAVQVIATIQRLRGFVRNAAGNIEGNAVEPLIAANFGSDATALTQCARFGNLHHAGTFENRAINQLDAMAGKLLGMLSNATNGIFGATELDASIREQADVETVHLRRPHFFGLATRRAASVLLRVVNRRDTVNPVSPDVRAQFGKREAGVQLHNQAAELGSRLALATRAVIQVVNVHPELVGERFALCRLGLLKIRSKVHLATGQCLDRIAMIDQKGLHSKPFWTFINLVHAGNF
nr:hypothetical protein [Paraburkholderia dilworthii]